MRRTRARLGEVLAGVDDEPVEPGRELRLAAELADPDDELRERVLRGVARVLGVAQQVQREPLDPRRRAARRAPRAPACRLLSRASRESGRRAARRRAERRACSRRIGRRCGEAGLHGAPTLVAVALVPELVLPRLRGAFGRAYLHADETPTTQTMRRPDAPHGTVALAEHQTAGRGRLGRVWVDEPGTGLALSVVLHPPPPVARWPELTLVAARRGRRRDRRRGDDQGSERRPARRHEGRRDPRRGRRARRPRDRRQRRRGALARRRLRRARPARAPGRDPRPARARLRRLARGP